MKKVLVIAMVVLVAALAAIAADQPNAGMAVGQSRNITLHEAAVVGGVTLPAGQYAVKHTMEGDAHIMVFQQVEGKATAKAACKMTPLEKKADKNSQMYSNTSKGRELTSLTFKRDTVRHDLAE